MKFKNEAEIIVEVTKLQMATLSLRQQRLHKVINMLCTPVLQYRQWIKIFAGNM